MNKTTVTIGITAALALLGIGVSTVWESHQTNKKIGKACDELKNASVRDITESMIKEAVNKAADISVDKYMRAANTSILHDANQTLSKEAAKLVNEQYNEMREKVSDRLAENLSNIDNPELLKKRICDKAESLLLKRFDSDLDDLKRNAKDAYDDAIDRYENRLSDAVDRFEDKLNDKLEGCADSIASMKRFYDKVESAFSRRGDRSGKEFRVTLG